MTEATHIAHASCGRLPAIVEAAGDAAVVSYRSYFDESGFDECTIRTYARTARRFFRWAERQGLRLESIIASDVAANASEVRARTSVRTGYASLIPVRGLFRNFVRTGVLTHNPCEPNTAAATPRRG